MRSVDAKPAFSKIVGFSRAGVKAWLTRLIRASIALVCSSTCACVALGSLKTALAAARRASTSAWSSCIELSVSFANKACRLPWDDLAAVVSATVGCSCSFPSPAWEGSWLTGFVSDWAELDSATACPWLVPSAGASCVFTSSAALSSAGWSVRTLFESPSSEDAGFPSALPSEPAVTTSLAVAGVTGSCAATAPLAKNINAATATLAAPKWYFRIEYRKTFSLLYFPKSMKSFSFFVSCFENKNSLIIFKLTWY